MSIDAPLLRLLAYIARQKGRLAVAVIFLVLGSIGMAFQSLIFGTVIEELTRGDASRATLWAFVIAAVAVISGLLTYTANRQLARLAQTGMEQLRNELVIKTQTLSLSFFDAEPSGDLSARVSSDIEAINQFFSSAVSRIISVTLTVTTMTIIIFSVDVTMSCVLLLIIPLTFYVVTLFTRRAKGNFADYQRLVGELNGYLSEAIEGQRTIKAFGKEVDSARRVRKLSDRARESDRSAQFLSYLMQPSNMVVNNFNLALIALVGGTRAISGTISVGDAVSFVGYSQQFGGQANQLSQVVPQVLSALAGANRVFEILDSTPDIADHKDALPMPAAKGKVDFDHVDFSYISDHQILFDNDFHVTPGQLIGLVGPTGAGKSTIINLLTRFYDIQAGRICLDEHAIDKLRLADLRQRCSVVLQVPFLFSESALYNIQYGRANATREECIEAARQAEAHTFIERLPQGYDTVLGGGSESLSQGQRQLLTIARAIVSQSDVLILDEATSSVDTRTERRIQTALDNLVANRTSFIIAHRLSTVRSADAIIVLEAGHIREMASHDQLMANRGYYYDLYMKQFRPELVQAFNGKNDCVHV